MKMKMKMKMIEDKQIMMIMMMMMKQCIEWLYRRCSKQRRSPGPRVVTILAWVGSPIGRYG